MGNIVISELQLGTVQFDWTFIFQVVNTLLWILIIYALYTYFKKFKEKRKNLENRVAKLEKEVEDLVRSPKK